MKKILYVHHFSGLGGATMSLFYIVEKLDRNRYEPIIMFLGGEGPGVDLFRQAGINVVVLEGITWYAHAKNARFKFISRRPLRPIGDFFRIIASVRKLQSLYEELGIELVHLNTSVLIPAGIAAKRSGIKVVWHIREPLYRGLLGIRRGYVRKTIINNSDAIIAISQEDASCLAYQGQNLHVIYNYVDFKKFDWKLLGKGVRMEFSIPDDRVVICNLGGVVHSKGPVAYLKAALEVWKKNADVVFILVGYPPVPKSEFIGRIKGLFGFPDAGRAVKKLQRANPDLQRIIFTGLRTDIPAILAASDILVWSATVPHFARPIIEAGAMQKPVVAADFPNSREIVSDGTTGLLYHHDDPGDLAARLNSLIVSAERRKVMGIEGYKIAKDRFNAKHNAIRIYDIYEGLLN